MTSTPHNRPHEEQALEPWHGPEAERAAVEAFRDTRSRLEQILFSEAYPTIMLSSPAEVEELAALLRRHATTKPDLRNHLRIGIRRGDTATRSAVRALLGSFDLLKDLAPRATAEKRGETWTTVTTDEKHGDGGAQVAAQLDAAENLLAQRRADGTNRPVRLRLQTLRGMTKENERRLFNLRYIHGDRLALEAAPSADGDVTRFIEKQAMGLRSIALHRQATEDIASLAHAMDAIDAKLTAGGSRASATLDLSDRIGPAGINGLDRANQYRLGCLMDRHFGRIYLEPGDQPAVIRLLQWRHLLPPEQRMSERLQEIDAALGEDPAATVTFRIYPNQRLSPELWAYLTEMRHDYGVRLRVDMQGAPLSERLRSASASIRGTARRWWNRLRGGAVAQPQHA